MKKPVLSSSTHPRRRRVLCRTVIAVFLFVVSRESRLAEADKKVGVVTMQEMSAHQKKVASGNPRLSLSGTRKLVPPNPDNPYAANDNQTNAQAAQLFTGKKLSGVNFVLYGQYCPDLSQCFEVSIDNAISSARIFGV